MSEYEDARADGRPATADPETWEVLTSQCPS